MSHHRSHHTHSESILAWQKFIFCSYQCCFSKHYLCQGQYAYTSIDLHLSWVNVSNLLIQTVLWHHYLLGSVIVYLYSVYAVYNNALNRRLAATACEQTCITLYYIQSLPVYSALWLLRSHSLENGGLRFTVRWGAHFLCLQLPDRKLREPGKGCSYSICAGSGLHSRGFMFACYSQKHA